MEMTTAAHCRQGQCYVKWVKAKPKYSFMLLITIENLNLCNKVRPQCNYVYNYDLKTEINYETNWTGKLSAINIRVLCQRNFVNSGVIAADNGAQNRIGINNFFSVCTFNVFRSILKDKSILTLMGYLYRTQSTTQRKKCWKSCI